MPSTFDRAVQACDAVVHDHHAKHNSEPLKTDASNTVFPLSQRTKSSIECLYRAILCLHACGKSSCCKSIARSNAFARMMVQTYLRQLGRRAIGCA